MNSRSKKYHESRKAGKGDKKFPSVESDETKDPKAKTPAKKNAVEPGQTDTFQLQESSATQDDTGGGNDTGKRVDEN